MSSLQFVKQPWNNATDFEALVCACIWNIFTGRPLPLSPNRMYKSARTKKYVFHNLRAWIVCSILSHLRDDSVDSK